MRWGYIAVQDTMLLSFGTKFEIAMVFAAWLCLVGML